MFGINLTELILSNLVTLCHLYFQKLAWHHLGIQRFETNNSKWAKVSILEFPMLVKLSLKVDSQEEHNNNQRNRVSLLSQTLF